MNDELAFQPGRQLVLLGKTGRQMLLMCHVPISHIIVIVVAVEMVTVIVVLRALAVIISVFILVVTTPLCQGKAAGAEEQGGSARTHPTFRFHEYLRRIRSG